MISENFENFEIFENSGLIDFWELEDFENFDNFENSALIDFWEFEKSKNFENFENSGLIDSWEFYNYVLICFFMFSPWKGIWTLTPGMSARDNRNFKGE